MHAMAAIEKLVAKIRANRKALRYDELVRVFGALGWSAVSSGTGSHQRFSSPDGSGYITVVRPHGGKTHVSPRAVDDLLAVWDDSRAQEADDDQP
ncbi:MAG: type II toxin-antitoxin system HicA family toxin [Armatimonadetes bacterium]|nr:type II toxin-antitoxin system HicA family toxin [Armatimonadota bacterium]